MIGSVGNRAFTDIVTKKRKLERIQLEKMKLEAEQSSKGIVVNENVTAREISDTFWDTYDATIHSIPTLQPDLK